MITKVAVPTILKNKIQNQIEKMKLEEIKNEKVIEPNPRKRSAYASKKISILSVSGIFENESTDRSVQKQRILKKMISKRESLVEKIRLFEKNKLKPNINLEYYEIIR